MCDTPLRRCAPSPRSRAVRGQGDDSLAAGRCGRLRPLLAVSEVGHARHALDCAMEDRHD
ncbi:hypothetical protein APV28_1743 [Comamonas testosteroni]|nr:hypothetical protein APV28_1743 [Comamonas testosteroni]